MGFSRLCTQETNTRASGRVISENDEVPGAVTVTLIHESTQNKYVSVTSNDGYFHFFNLKPGGPYTIIISSVSHDTLKKTDLFIHLTNDHFFNDNKEVGEFRLQKKIKTLGEVIVNTRNDKGTRGGIETNITSSVLSSMPTISRNFQDFVRLVPQAKVNGEGAMSLAGQNNRFNAFFIDGSNNNDIQGIAVNGMNGGQTGSPPVSTEAIEELNVLLAPYDVTYGNFTGGSINAITRSGSNENKSSAWYYFRNENLAGRSPQPILMPDSSGKSYRPKLSPFFNQTIGAWNSGAIVKNKLFYYALFEVQSETRPQPFDMSAYQGNSKTNELNNLTEFLNDFYQYDPGSFLESKDKLDAVRMMIKLDWNPSLKNKFALAYRYNKADRVFLPRVSSNNGIYFENNGIDLIIRNHTGSFEWKYFIRNNMSNRLLLTFTNQTSNRNWLGEPFPQVTILDGNHGSITFGSEPNTGINDLNANDFTLFNVFKYVEKKHVFTIGADLNYTTLDNRTVPAYFGYYTFANLDSFINVAPPLRLQRSYFLAEEPNNRAKFHTLRTSLFLNDEIRPQSNLKFNFGIRLDVNSVVSKPKEDPFFNDSLIHVIAGYYDLDGAKSGQTMKPHWAISPRVSVDYKIRGAELNVKGGAGIFVGHIVNIWHYDVFNNNLGSIDIRKPTEFISDPYNQPDSNLRDLNLIGRHFKYPSVFRSSLVVSKELRNNWTLSLEGIFTQNITDVAFRNINILPPTRKTEPPDSRNVYAPIGAAPPVIKGYGTMYLLTNNHDKKGQAYSISFIVQKQAKDFSFSSSYTYGRSSVLFEITGAQTPIRSQWRNMETVNGRNYTTLSTSDNNLRHRITTWASKRFNYAKNRSFTTLSLFYNGQSGNPYSYVYTNSMVNDNGSAETFDLIYIPTKDDLATMRFTQNEYTPGEQKDFLNDFIESDKYLKKHRGEFAKRNGARLPFVNTIDLRLQQDFSIKIKEKIVGIAVTYDVFNFLNMLNKDWGRIYFLSNDSYPLIKFDGYVSNTTPDIIPQYQFKPINGKPYALQTSTIPGNSARWISQLGFKVSLN